MAEQKLKYKKRFSTSLILTDNEREEIAKRIIEFMKSCFILEN